MLVVGLFLLSVLLVLQVLAYRKLRKVHLATFRLLEGAAEAHSLFHQFQAYDSLMRLINPGAPLPLLRGWAASPDLLLLLAQHIIKHKPDHILECSSGASTLVMARCCQRNGKGHVWSLEHDEDYAKQTRERLAEHGLEVWASVIHSPLVPTGASRQPWYDLAGLGAPDGGFDMLVIDGPPNSSTPLARYPALPQLDPLLKSGAFVFLDDASRKGEQQALARWKLELPHYTDTALPLEKGGRMLIKNFPSAGERE